VTRLVTVLVTRLVTVLVTRLVTRPVIAPVTDIVILMTPSARLREMVKPSDPTSPGGRRDALSSKDSESIPEPASESVSESISEPASGSRPSISASPLSESPRRRRFPTRKL
jgi:hypothetical protein